MENYSIDEKASIILNQAKHITAVGTTSVRVLESAFSGSFLPTNHASTDIFIQEASDIKVVNSLITNFHLPSTSLMILVSAFTGPEALNRIYKHAIAQRYRFYSFGDAMLIN